MNDLNITCCCAHCVVDIKYPVEETLIDNVLLVINVDFFLVAFIRS